MDMARKVAERSTCDRAHVGCVLVRDNRVLATGYNGSVSGMPHCNDVGHYIVNNHCKRTIHAEMNAIIQCALHGVSSKGAIVYVTHYPCYDCAKVLVNAGVLVVNYEQTYGVLHDVFERIGVYCIL